MNSLKKQEKNASFVSDNIRAYAIVGALIIMWIAFNVLTNGNFLSPRNISNLAGQTAAAAVVAVGMVFCLVTGNIDLAVDPMVALSGAIIGILSSRMNLSAGVAVGAALLAGVLIGCWNGFWVAYKKVPAFIVTLGGSMLFKGVVLLLTQGATIAISNPRVLSIGKDFVPAQVCLIAVVILLVLNVFLSFRRRQKSVSCGLSVPPILRFVIKQVLIAAVVIGFTLVLNSYKGIPYSIVLVALLVVLATFVLSRTTFGRHIYAIGGNGKAAHYSGINLKVNTLIVFIITNVLTMLSGFVLVGRLGNATASAGSSFGLDAIAACVIGGVSLNGGRGTVMGAMIGALMMSTLNNGMSLLNIDSSLQYVIKGLILIVAVWMDLSSKDKRAAIKK